MEPEEGFAALLPRVTEIAEATVGRCTREIPAYRVLPAGVLERDLVANARAVLELFLRTVAEGRSPTEAELAPPIAWGAERARDGVPLAAVLRIYPLGATVAWQRVAAEPESGIDPDALVTRLLEFLGEVMPRVAEAYLRERDELDWAHREHRQHLAGALLAGRPARRSAERYGRTLADRYEVVAFRLPAVAGDRAATRLLRVLHAELDRCPEVLVAFKGDGGALLIPEPGPGAEALLARLDTATGLRCTAAAARAQDHQAVPGSHAEAAELLSLVEQLGYPVGLYRLPDLAVEYQLARPGPARDALAGLLEPLAGHPHLLDALRAFLAADGRRSVAAAALNLHRNTLTYRLGRVQILTGYDATRPADARRLAAAVTAYDIGRRTG
ncbi:helix-turn-helix domain-containing protein [Streptomyces sp. NPDC089919]|uniref:PucR family transcriptional regulator n=1 Tax=Streptomyces sp. NPDC089919 TaxID=3155188 RepID=UPI0034277439